MSFSKVKCGNFYGIQNFKPVSLPHSRPNHSLNKWLQNCQPKWHSVQMTSQVLPVFPSRTQSAQSGSRPRLEVIEWHPAEKALEHYAMKKEQPDKDVCRIEEHLLTCSACCRDVEIVSAMIRFFSKSPIPYANSKVKRVGESCVE